MSTLRRRPVSRPKVLLGALVTIGVLWAALSLLEWLRPGRDLPSSPITAELDADPRIAVSCPQEPAREGRREAAPSGGRVTAVGSSQLYDCPTTWDGRPVRFTGEVVGGVLQRGEHAWLQLNDDVYAGELGPLVTHRDFRGGNAGVGVLVPIELVERIRRVGGPTQRGDVVEVSGVYRRVDPETREAAIIRAGSLRVVRPGEPIPRPVDPVRAMVAVVLSILATAALCLQWWAHRRRLRR